MRADPTLGELLSDIWSARRQVFTGAIIFNLIAVAVIAFSKPLYRASMIVAPADGYALGDYASSVSEGEAMTLPFWRPHDQEGVSTDFYRFIYTIGGSSVAAILLSDQAVIDGIHRDGQFFHPSTKLSAEELAAYLEKNLHVEHLGTTALRRISYSHPDPVFAAAFLRKIHLVSDQLIRRERRRQSENRIKYLEDTLQKTVNPEHRKGIADLLMQQEHVQMLANLDEPYAAIIVEPPAATPKPVWPDKPLLLGIFAIAGGIFGYLYKAMRRGR